MLDFGTRFGYFISFFVASGGMFSIIASVTLMIAIRDKKLIHYLHAGFFFLMGFCLLCDPYYRLGTQNLAPHLLYVNYPFVLLIGPLFFLYFKSLFDRKFKLSPRHLMLLLPAIVTAGAFIPYYILPVETKLAFFPIENQPAGYFRTIGVISEYFMFPWNALCCALSIKYSLSILGKKNKTFWITFVFLITVVTVCVLLIYANTIDDISYYKIEIAIITFLTIVLAVITASNPSFYIRIRMGTSASKYTQSKLTSLNVDALITRIEDLMDYEHLYRDSELSLAGLSERLEISPQQLSEIINSQCGKNFNSYINDFRIAAAKKMLLNENGSSILSVGLACGFNSKSNFNHVFQKSVGMTPTEYRTAG